MSKLLQKHCVPCEGGTAPLSRAQAEEYLLAAPGWTISDDGKKISHEVVCKDFMTAVKQINEIATLAESEGHHPDIHLTSWNHLLVELWTHAIGGLSDNDFIMTAKINRILGTQQTSS